MKRRWIAGAAVVVLTGSVLTGCSLFGQDDKLTLWTPLTGDDGAFMKEIVEAYNDTDPEYQVEFQAVPELYTKISTTYNAGSGLPEFAIIHSPNLQDLAKDGVLVPVASWTEAAPDLASENYLDQAWNGGTVDGEQYGIPLDMHGVIGYYNVDLVEQYGATSFLDDGIVTVDELKTLEGKLPEGTYAFPPLFIPGLVHPWSLSQGADMQPEDVDLTSPEWQQSFQALIDLQRAGLIAPEDSDSNAVFNSGQALFYPDGTWGYSGKTAIDGLNFAEMNAIQFNADNPVNMLASHEFVQFADNGVSEEKQAGIAAFLDFVRQNSLPWAQAGQVVASRAIYDSPEYQEFPQSFLTSDPQAVEMLVVDDSSASQFIGAQLWSRSNDIVWERVPLEQGLEEMQSELSAVLAEAGK